MSDEHEINVGDLVRVEGADESNYNETQGSVVEVDEGLLGESTLYGVMVRPKRKEYFFRKELVLIRPKAALETVYQEEKVFGGLRDDCYALCRRFYSNNDMDRATLEHEINQIFNPIQ